MTAPLELSLAFEDIQVVEASAGTGKTWLIAALYVRLVLGHGAPCIPRLPPQILVVTYTKAATSELRDRIRARLTEAAAVFRGAASGDAFLQALLDEYPAGDARDAAALRLEIAAQWMDEAAIHTIHGWCQRMLTRHAFDSGRPFEQSASADEAELLAEACRDYWRRECYPLSLDVLEEVLDTMQGPDALARAIRGLVSKTGCVIEGGIDGDGALGSALAQMSACRREAESALRQQWRGILAEFEAALPSIDALANKRKWHVRWYGPWLATLKAWADGAAEAPAIGTGATRMTRAGMAEVLPEGVALPELAIWDAVPVLQAFHASGLPVEATILRHALPRIRAAVAEAKQRAALIGFDDMLALTAQALKGDRGEAFARRLRETYPVALIDEFQDTDASQWETFRSVYGEGGGALLLIGDPKQAIYGFRGADIEAYFGAREAAVARHTLGCNYRSTTAMVAAVNAVFEHGDAACADGAFRYGLDDSGLAFHRVTAAGRDDRLVRDGGEVPALTFACDASPELITKGAYNHAMAQAAADAIAGMLQAAAAGTFRIDGGKYPRPVSAGDIAVLVRTGREAGLVTDALRDRGLACVFLSDAESIYASGEASDLLLWLRAMAEPGSDRALRAAMATPSFAYDLQAIAKLSIDELYREQCIDRFRDAQHAWRRAGVLAAVRRLMHGFGIPARLFATGRGERASTNLLHLAELLQHAAVGLDGEHALIRFLAEEIAAGRPGGEGNDTRIVRLETEDDLVKVCTIHKAKGLEYPIVFLPFACGFREATDAIVEYRRAGERVISLESTAGQRAAADLERMREDARLLYVALTRAQFACWVGVGAIGEGRERSNATHKSALGYLLGGGRELEPAGLSQAIAAVKVRSPGIVSLELPTETGRIRVTPGEEAGHRGVARQVTAPQRPAWWTSSYSAIARGAVSDPESAMDAILSEESAPASQHAEPASGGGALDAFPRGTTAGSFLHYLLEWAAGFGFARCIDEPERVRMEIDRRCDAAGWSDWAPVLADWLPTFLAQPLALPDGPVALAGLARGRYRAEFEFQVEARGVQIPLLDGVVRAGTLDGAVRPTLASKWIDGMLKGFIDLVFESNGRWWVADYKGNHLSEMSPPYGRSGMLASIIDHRYDLQYVLYLLALHRFLRARLPDYDYERDVGGAVYLYLRGVDAEGNGVFADKPPLATIEALDALFAGSRKAITHAA
jgi:exodeoxyribonuclease V beta subunit